MTPSPRIAHHYALLGLRPDAADEEIKRAWKRLAARWHPDLAKGASNKRFEALREAWDLLSHPGRRAEYDALLQERIDARVAAMSQLSGVQRLGGAISRVIGVRASAAEPGRNRKLRVSVALAEAARGTERDVYLQGEVRCDACDATGCAPNGRTWVCESCAGIGEVLTHGAIRSAWATCPGCDGLGWVAEPACPRCGGSGAVEESLRWTVPIPAGTTDGRVLKLAGAGERGVGGGPPGDLLVEVEVRAHAFLTARGKDLCCDRPIPFWLAIAGGSVEVPTLDGTARIRVPPDTRSGDVLRMAGWGLGGGGADMDDARGDELVTIIVEWPPALPAEAAQALAAWGASLPAEAFPDCRDFDLRLASAEGSSS